MNRAHSLRALLVVLLAAGLRAEDATPVAAQPAADGLSAAKRDYESISHAHSSPDLQKLDGTAPEPSTQNLTLGEPVADSGGGMGAMGRVAKPAKSTNWLVDGVMDQKPSPLEELKAEAAPGSHLSESKLPPAPAKPGDGVVNPLTSYMAEWMTPHDLEVLKVKEADTKPSMLPDKAIATDSTRDNYFRTDPAPGAGASSPSLGGITSDARSNPYLTELALGNAETKSALSTPAAAPAPLAPASFPSDLAPVKNNGMPADMLKAQEDAKYFRQLKRF